MHTFTFHPNGLTGKRQLSSREIIEIAISLYDNGWRSSDRARLIERYDLTGREADLILAGISLLE